MYTGNAYYPNGYPVGTNVNANDDRLIAGGALGPFLLGGLTGGLVAPYFYPRPYYRPYQYRPFNPPYGPYRPYPPRW